MSAHPAILGAEQPRCLPAPYLAAVEPGHPDAALVELWRQRNDMLWPVQLGEGQHDDEKSYAFSEKLSELEQRIATTPAWTIVGLAIKARLLWTPIEALMPGPQERKSAGQPTPRQREVLQLLAEGCSMKEAAQILGVAPRTIAFHKYRIMEQFRLKSNAELIQFAIRQDVISTQQDPGGSTVAERYALFSVVFDAVRLASGAVT